VGVGRDSSVVGGTDGGWLPGERQLSELHTVLWTVVILSSLFDVVTTMVGMERGLGESPGRSSRPTGRRVSAC